MKILVQRSKSEAGQALIFICIISMVLIGTLGWGLDAAQMYAHRQMAQAATDAAAQAGVMSIFVGTNTGATYGGTAPYASPALYTCTSADASSGSKSPCRYAAMNGFTPASGDTVALTFGDNTTTGAPAAPLSAKATDPVSWMTVTITRAVPTTFLRILGINNTTITTTATAAIVNTISPVPIIVTHPSMAGALNMNGTTGVTIIGGPSQSIQVNSNDPTGNAVMPPSSGNVDLRGAGPGGTGGDFGTYGGPSSQPGSILVGTGNYLPNSYPILDPLANVSPPTAPGSLNPNQNGQLCSAIPGGGHCGDCPAPQFSGAAPATCTEYTPGLYSSLIVSGVSSAIFDPGVYYIRGGGFQLKNSTVQMCSSCTADANTVNGMVIYDTGTTSSPTASGGFNIDTNTYATLWGGGVSATNLTAVPSSPYYGIAFFEDHAADAHTGSSAHTLGAGNGCFSIVGTVYMTNTLSIMKSSAAHYQSVVYHGNPCSSTQNVGEIIASQLTVKGSSGLNMRLLSTGYLAIREVALVQ